MRGGQNASLGAAAVRGVGSVSLRLGSGQALSLWERVTLRIRGGSGEGRPKRLAGAAAVRGVGVALLQPWPETFYKLGP